MNNPRCQSRVTILAQINNLDKMKLAIVDLEPLYSKDHPEIGQELKVIYMLIQQLQDLLTAFREAY